MTSRSQQDPGFVPLVNGISHLPDRLPSYVASAQHGRGWIGRLAAQPS
jgi:hypothetical protein